MNLGGGCTPHLSTDCTDSLHTPLRPTPQDRLPWEPMLTAEEVQRALGYYGSGSSMRRVAAKLLAGQPIKVG